VHLFVKVFEAHVGGFAGALGGDQSEFVNSDKFKNAFLFENALKVRHCLGGRQSLDQFIFPEDVN
jgi:hypothetical protein